MIKLRSLPGITRAGSKGMISARNIKAPQFDFEIFKFRCKDRK